MMEKFEPNAIISDEVGKFLEKTGDSSKEINELLKEADNYGLRWEVVNTAMSARKSNPEMSLLDSIREGFQEWVK